MVHSTLAVRIDIVRLACYPECMKAQSRLISAALREQIESSGRSLYELAAKAGMARGVLSRFMRRERDICMATADKLCRVLGLELKATKRTRTAKGG